MISRLFEVMLVDPDVLSLDHGRGAFAAEHLSDHAIIGATSWVGIARFTRNEFLQDSKSGLRDVGDRARGFRPQSDVQAHSCRTRWRPSSSRWCLGIAGAILVESSLSFLGIGVPAELVTWGSILHEASTTTFAWWLAVFPGFAIFITVLAYYLVGEGLREVLDPRLRGLR